MHDPLAVIVRPLRAEPRHGGAGLQDPLTGSGDVHFRPAHLLDVIGGDFEGFTEGPLRVVAHRGEIPVGGLEVRVEGVEVEGREGVGVGFRNGTIGFFSPSLDLLIATSRK